MIYSARAAPLEVLQYHGTPRQNRKDQTVADHFIVVIAHKRKTPVIHVRSRETRKRKRGRSSVIGSKDTGVKVALSSTKEMTATIEMRVETLAASNHPVNMGNLIILLGGGTTTMYSPWRQRSAAHERASQRIRFLHLRSLSGANTLR